MHEWLKFKRKPVMAEMRPYQPGEPMDGISVSEADRIHGSPQAGDRIASDHDNISDQWLVGADYFQAKFITTPQGSA